MKAIRLFTYLIFATILAGCSSNSHEENPSFNNLNYENKILMEFFSSTNGANWKNTRNWGTDKPISEWYGIKAIGDQIIEIILPNNNLTGSIPESLTKLSNLEALNIEDNNISGGLPNGLENLRQLSIFKIANNRFSGSLPNKLSENPNYECWDKNDVYLQQYGYGFQNYESILTLQKSNKSNGVNIVFLGDGFLEKDLYGSHQFENLVKKGMEHFFSVEPTKTYRNYFNIYAVKAISQSNSFTGRGKTVFDVKFGEGTYVYGNDTTCTDYALKAPIGKIENTLVIILVNKEIYAGTCAMYTNGSAFAYVPLGNDRRPQTSYRGLIIHEALGHGFGKLSDEYITNKTHITNEATSEILKFVQYGFYDNVSLTSNPDLIKWRHFFSLPRYQMVKSFEGTALYRSGVWRPEFNATCMNDNRPYFDAPSRETMVKKIKSIAKENFSFSDFIAKDKYEPANNTRFSSSEEIPHTPPLLFIGEPGKAKRLN